MSKLLNKLNVESVDSSGALTLGSNNATSVGIGKAGVSTNVDGGLNVAQSLTVTGNTTLNGNLSVTGTTTTTLSETVNIKDAQIYLNQGYSTNTAVTGGLVVNYFPTTTATTVAAAGFVAGNPGTAPPYVTTVAVNGFNAGDFIQINGSNNPANDGLFEVLTHAASELTIRGVGGVDRDEDFTQNDFVTDATAGGSITGVNVSVMRAGVDGVWEVAKGSATGLTFTDLGLSTGGDHGALDGLLDDDHTQYTLLAGRATGQTLTGGTGNSENLTLTSTSHATKGAIIMSDPVQCNNIDTTEQGAILRIGVVDSLLVDLGHEFSDTRVNGQLIVIRKLGIDDVTASVGGGTGALSVAGGVGISKNIHVTTTANIGGIVTLAATTASAGVGTGALVVAGGVGIGGAVNVGGAVDIASTTGSASTITGALVVDGGVGVAQNVYVGGIVNVTGQTQMTTATASGVVTLSDGTASSNATSGALVVTGGVGIGGAVNVGTTVNAAGIVTLSNGTASSSTGTGALVVTGGVGIGGGVTAAGFTTTTGTITAGNLQLNTNTLAATGDLTLTSTSNSIVLGNGPTQATHATTKSYVDAIALGLTLKQSVDYVTVALLPTYAYDNGIGNDGVGATITGDIAGQLIVDGVAVVVTNRVLVVGDGVGLGSTSAVHNGIYVVTNDGSSAQFVLTRATDADNNPSSEIVTGLYTTVLSGNTRTGVSYAVTVFDGLVGTDDIEFTQISAPGATTASNVGTGGVGIYKQKSGNDLELRNINTSTNTITVSLDAGDNEIDIALVPGNITTVGALDTGSIGGVGDTFGLISTNSNIQTSAQISGTTIVTNSIDAKTAATMVIGGATATAVEIADTGVVTAVKGGLTIEGLLDTAIGVTLDIGGTTATKVEIGKDGFITEIQGPLVHLRPLRQKIDINANGSSQTPAIAALNPITVFTSANVLTYTLPAVTSVENGMTLTFINSSTGIKTIHGNAINIDEVAQVSLSQWDRLTIIYCNDDTSARWISV